MTVIREQGANMRIDRRHFLAFGIGGAVGTALSPLPWKLTDDLSIWTQNWSWVPVPADGEYRIENTVCTLCPGGCGVSVRMVDDRPVKIEGRKGFPVNDGGICLMGLSGLQLLYSPSRIQSPMRRVGQRGEGKWETLSWDEAISQVAKQLGELKKKQDSGGLGCICGSAQGTTPALFKRFLAAFGSPNFFTMPSAADAQALTMNRMHQATLEMGFDLENADFILSFGAGILEGWGSAVRSIRAASGWRENGVALVQIEPRLSNTAARASQWVPITPGSEAIVALGIAHVMIQSSGYDKEFIEKRTRGFEAFRNRVLQQYPPERVEAETGVARATLTALADAFSKAKRPIAISGRGVGRVPGGLGETAAIHALNALAGNLNRAGGVLAVPFPDYIDWPEIHAGKNQARLDGAGSGALADTPSLLHRVPQLLNSSKDAPLKTLFVHGANPVYALPDARSVKAAFEKIPFIVSFSSSMDETSLMADILLPDHHYLEGYRDVPKPPGYCRPFIGLAVPVLPPQFDTQHSGDTLIQLAAKMGDEMADAFPWEDYERCLEETLGDSWPELKEKGFWEDTGFAPIPWERFPKGSGDAVDFQAVVDAPEPVVLPARGEIGEYPFFLVAFDSIRLSSGYVSDTPFMVKTLEDTVLKATQGFVEVNPATAIRLGLFEGDVARVKTPVGEAVVRIHLFDGIKPGVLAIPRGLGHVGVDPYTSGKGVNVNDLLGPMEDPKSGLNAAWGIRASLSRA